LTNFNKFSIVEKSISWAIRINQNIVNLVESLRQGATFDTMTQIPKNKWNDMTFFMKM